VYFKAWVSVDGPGALRSKWLISYGIVIFGKKIYSGYH